MKRRIRGNEIAGKGGGAQKKEEGFLHFKNALFFFLISFTPKEFKNKISKADGNSEMDFLMPFNFFFLSSKLNEFIIAVKINHFVSLASAV